MPRLCLFFLLMLSISADWSVWLLSCFLASLFSPYHPTSARLSGRGDCPWRWEVCIFAHSLQSSCFSVFHWQYASLSFSPSLTDKVDEGLVTTLTSTENAGLVAVDKGSPRFSCLLGEMKPSFLNVPGEKAVLGDCALLLRLFPQEKMKIAEKGPGIGRSG